MIKVYKIYNKDKKKFYAGSGELNDGPDWTNGGIIYEHFKNADTKRTQLQMDGVEDEMVIKNYMIEENVPHENIPVEQDAPVPMDDNQQIAEDLHL